MAAVAAPLAAVAAIVAGTAVGWPGGEPVPDVDPPRVCWFSDYDNKRLSNRCDYDAEARRWFMEVDGRRVPADEQPLPEANLCHYFSGTHCPARDRKR